MRTAILGAGSLGTILGALLTRTGQDVELIDANPVQVQSLKNHGARITGKMELVVPVKAFLPEKMSGIYDLIIYLVKVTANAQALPLAARHMNEHSILLTMQNGIPEPACAEVIGKERTMGCAVGWGATWLEPGVSMLTSEPDKMTFDIGELDGSDSPRLAQLVEFLQPVGIPEKTLNLLGLRWTKLTANATFSGMSTVLSATYGDVLDNPRALQAAAHIGREALAVLRAADITPQPIQGFDIRYLDFHNSSELASILPVYGIIFGPHRALKASMLQDIEKGEPCEIDAINGTILEWARRFKVETPVNAAVVDTIQQMQDGNLSARVSHLDRISLPDIPAE